MANLNTEEVSGSLVEVLKRTPAPKIVLDPYVNYGPSVVPYNFSSLFDTVLRTSPGLAQEMTWRGFSHELMPTDSASIQEQIHLFRHLDEEGYRKLEENIAERLVEHGGKLMNSASNNRKRYEAAQDAEEKSMYHREEIKYLAAAYRFFEKAVEIRPGYEDALILLLEVNNTLHLKSREAADDPGMRFFNTAAQGMLSRLPQECYEDSYVLVVVGKTHGIRGNYEQSEMFFEQALALDPDVTDAVSDIRKKLSTLPDLVPDKSL